MRLFALALLVAPSLSFAPSISRTRPSGVRKSTDEPECLESALSTLLPVDASLEVAAAARKPCFSGDAYGRAAWAAATVPKKPAAEKTAAPAPAAAPVLSKEEEADKAARMDAVAELLKSAVIPRAGPSSVPSRRAYSGSCYPAAAAARASTVEQPSARYEQLRSEGEKVLAERAAKQAAFERARGERPKQAAEAAVPENEEEEEEGMPEKLAEWGCDAALWNVLPSGGRKNLKRYVSDDLEELGTLRIATMRAIAEFDDDPEPGSRDAWMKASNAWAQVEAEKLAAAIKAEKEAKKAARMAAAAAKKAAAEAEVASE